MTARLQWWGGAECSVNRVANEHYDQLERTGHAHRLDDLDRIASLGIERVRFPVLWERTWCSRRQRFDFEWADVRMQRMRELGLTPIVGLLHHGSGPLHTHLLDDAFPAQLAEFAEQVALRYPWVENYTPVNEILTTARFSGLYGHWYPHARDDRSFVRALLGQVRATQLAMRAIRKTVPNAKLVSTEDIGTVFSTPPLEYQAHFENQRRWLSLDLLFGRVEPCHPLYRYLVTRGGACPSFLRTLAEEHCAPDVIGLNYYVTSDRFLDHRLRLYPSCLHGGNGRHEYADVEAVRILPAGIVGHYQHLNETWERYQNPLALTEVHLGCDDERERARWLEEAWNAARRARANGVDVRAVTAWSLFGSFDWDSLITRCSSSYEAGAFDVRCEPPRATLVAQTLRRLATLEHSSPGEEPGWWSRDERLLYPAVDACEELLPVQSGVQSTVSGDEAPVRQRSA